MDKNRERVQDVLILLALMLAGGLVRAWLATHPWGPVEVERVAATLEKRFTWDPFRPPLFYVLMYLWKPWAATPFLWRLPVVLTSTLLIPASYYFMRRLTGRRGEALAAAFLTALSAFQIEFAHWLVDYPLLSLFFLASMGCYWKMAQGTAGKTHVVVYVIAQVLALQTHYLGMAMMIFQGGYWIWRRGLDKTFWRFAGLVCVVMLFAPWWLSLWSPMKQHDLTPFTWNTGLILPYSLYAFFVSHHFAYLHALSDLPRHPEVIAPLLALGGLMVWTFRQGPRDEQQKFLVYFLIAPVIFFWLLSFKFPRFGQGLTKYSFPYALFFNFLLARALARLPGPWLRPAAFVLYGAFQIVALYFMAREAFGT